MIATYNLKTQADCLASFDDLSATLGKLEEYSAKARAEFGEGSIEHWSAEVAIVQLLSTDLGRVEDGLARYKAAMAKANPSWSLSNGSASYQEARMYLELATLEAQAGHFQEGRQALNFFEAHRPPPGDTGSNMTNLNAFFLGAMGLPATSMAAMMWDYPALAVRIQLGEGAQVRTEMESREAQLPVSALAVLYKLERDFGNVPKAQEVLARTSELLVASADESVSRGEGEPALGSGLAPSYWLSMESYAARDALDPARTRANFEALFWLSEQRKALIAREAAAPAQDGDTIAADVRARRAAAFFQGYDGLAPRRSPFVPRA